MASAWHASRYVTRTVLLAGLLGCTGILADPIEAPSLCKGMAADVGPSGLRRLTVSEIERTLAELFGQPLAIEELLPQEGRARGYDNQTSAQSVTEAHVEAWLTMAEHVTDQVLGDGTQLAGCDVELDDSRCASRVISEFGARVFQRPLTTAEHDRLLAFYELRSAETEPLRALELLVQGMLISPQFLYLPEPGAEGEITSLDAYSLARRLSYLLWKSGPDVALTEAATNGRLLTRDGIEEQARRMVADPRAAEVVRDFYLQWSDAYDLTTLVVPAGFDSSLAASAQTATARLIDHWYASGGHVADLLTTTTVFVDSALARYYGLAPVDGSGWAQRRLDPQTHGGLLTRAAFVGTHSIPPNRGDFVLGKLLCTNLEVPPFEIPSPPEGAAYPTRRARFEAHTQQDCATACHSIIDPIGFAFEHYDESGQWRAQDNDLPIDATTVLSFSDPQLDGPIEGAMELSERLANSDAFMTCHVEQWFTYAFQRPPGSGDACTIESLRSAFVRSGGRVEELLVQLALSDAFRLVRKEAVP